MPLTPAERAALIERYARGPALLRAAFDRVPAEARQWRPGPGKWSAHEVVVHCADSESNAALRIRYLLAEADPVIQGYDQERWARELDYHDHPADVALATVEAVRAHTVPLLRRLTDADWQRVGRHTESGAYGADDWLRIYAEHLEKHAGQIARNLAAWQAR
ncbi:MAG TPA: DinB family protein [Gemmatimonadales bacterium]|nr:DinB family protein [Gemmatimonadales bacterium]